MNIAVTGFFGTGSSAVLDLLKEYDGVVTVPQTGHAYEHSVFFVPGGLFSLCSQLLHGNSPQGSDMVVNNFVDAMRRLNDNDFGWFGSYKAMFGDEFMNIVNRFVERISVVRASSNSNHALGVRFSLAKAVAQYVMHILKKRSVTKYGTWYIKDKKPVYFSMPTEDELYAAAREFTSGYMSLFAKNTNSRHLIFDHLIWPQQVSEFRRCFDDSLKVIVSMRDPRDVYVSDQFIWSEPPMGHSKAHFPSNVEDFVDEWRRTMALTSKSDNLMVVHFEDLVCHYEATKAEIEKFLGIEPSQHTRAKQFFRPEASIENSQVFLLRDEWRTLADKIASGLPEYIHDFGEERVPNKKLIFK